MMRKLIIISLFLFGLSYDSRTSAENTAPVRNPGSNPNQWALLIGVGDYPGNTVDLKYPGADARSIKDLLISSAGFAENHIRLLTDDGAGEARATKQNIFGAIDQYLAPRVQPGHEIIIFLAGHGIVDGVGAQAKSYFLSVDTDIQSKETVARTAIDMEELISKLSALKASQFTLFYDACREDPSPGRGFKGNPLTDVTARILTLTPTRIQQSRPEAPAPTSVVFYACQIGERAFESPQLQHGVFTYYILRGLRELADRPDGRVEAGRLAGYLTENVRKWSQEAKNPFGQNQNPTMVATDVRGPVLVARVLPLSANVPDTTAVSGIRLNTFPEGATISINGQQAGRGPIQKDLTPNQYTVRAELPGFQASETRVNVIAGYRQEITINLQASAGNSNYEKGIQFERQQLWPQAIASYQQALAEDPNSESAYESLSQVYVKNGRYREAVDLLTAAAQKFPNNALILARRSRAQSAMRLGEDTLAASFGPQTGGPQSNEGAGQSSGKKSKKGKKSETTKKSKKKDEEVAAAPATQSFAPQPEEESGKKSKKGKKSGTTKKSKKKDEEALSPPPASQSFAPQPEEESGKKSKKSGKKDEEAQSGDQAQGGKDGKKSKSGKGGKKSDKESSDKNQGEKNQGGEIQSRSLAGAIRSEAQDKGAAGSSDAIRDAELAIQKNDNLAEAHLALGFALLADRKDYDRALAAFVRASTIAPDDAEAYFGVGYAYRLKQQCEQAVPQLKKAIELRPDYYEAQRELAYCYHTTGATDLAIRQYVVATSYRAQTKEASEYAANNLALAALYRKKGDEIGGAQAEEYRKTGKACEDDARKEEPDLKRAAKKLGSAGVLRFVQEKAPPEIRPFLQGLNFLNGGKSSVNSRPAIGVKIPLGKRSSIGVGLPIGISIGKKSPKVSKSKTLKDVKAPTDIKTKTPINIGIPIRTPIGSKTPKGDNAPTPTRPIVRPTPKPAPQPTPKPIIRR
jgi:tetratricopeptide (TPR) repeat protein/uncharacterized caspase-like protein